MAALKKVSALTKLKTASHLTTQNRHWSKRKNESTSTSSDPIISVSIQHCPNDDVIHSHDSGCWGNCGMQIDTNKMPNTSLRPAQPAVYNLHSCHENIEKQSQTAKAEWKWSGSHQDGVLCSRFFGASSPVFGMCPRAFSTLCLSKQWPNVGCTQQNSVLSQQVRSVTILHQEKTVTPSEMKKFLSDNEINVEQGHTCLKITCPRVTKEKVSQKEQLFINLRTGYFVCLNCKKCGSWDLLQDNIAVHRSDIDQKRKRQACVGEDSMNEKDRMLLLKTWEATEAIHEDSDIDDILLEFDIKELNKAILKQFSVRVDHTGNRLILPVFWERPLSDKNLHGLKILSKNDDGIDEKTVPSGRLSYWCLFGINTVTAKSTDRVIITANEFDAMAVFQELRQPVLSLPWGNDTLPLEVLPFLEQFDHIVLWFGNDITGFNAARQLSKKLGYERCSLFRPLTPVPTPMDALRQGKSLSRILKFATRAGHQYIQHFKDLRFEVQSELSLVEQVKGIQFKRFPLLNKLLKGHRRGELTIVTGPTGSGKTTFISELSLDLCIQGVNTLWGSFEIKNVRLMKTMLIQFARKNLATHFAEFDKYADQFEQLPMHFMAFHGQESLKRVIDTMDHAVYVHDISHIIVDNLQFMMGMGQLGDRNRNFDRLTQQDEVVAAFRQFATSKNCHVTLVIHPRKEPNGEALHIGSIFGSAKASQEADNILLLQLVENMKVTTQPKKYIQVAKNRFDGDLGSMLLKFDKDSLSFGSKPSTSKPSTEENIQETIQPNNQLHSEHSEEASDEEL